MPPKKHEVQIVVEVPEQPPTMEDGALVDKLLQLVLTHPNDVAATVASALKYDDYLTNLQNGIVVDLWVETLIMCAQNSFKANKTMAVLELVEAMRQSIVLTQSDAEAKAMLKAFFVRHAGCAVKEKELYASNMAALDGATAEGGIVLGPDGKPIPGGAGGAGAAGAGGSGANANNGAQSPSSGAMTAGDASGGVSPGAKGAKGAAAKGKKGVEEPPPPPKPTFDAGMFFIDTEETKAIAPTIVMGLLQHWQLYATVGAYKRTELFVPAASTISDAVLEPVTCSFVLGIQTPMPSHSLSMAIPQEEHIKNHADEDARAAAERAELQAREEAQIASEKAALEAMAAKRKADEEEERAGIFYLKKATSEKAAENLVSSIEGELSDRQRRIIQRIMKLEDALQLATTNADM